MAKSSEGKSGGSEQDKEASLALMTDANSAKIQGVQRSYTSLKNSHWTQIKIKRTTDILKNSKKQRESLLSVFLVKGHIFFPMS